MQATLPLEEFELVADAPHLLEMQKNEGAFQINRFKTTQNPTAQQRKKNPAFQLKLAF